ncbi:TetR/AcrR family transcriptional regulator [Nocardia goodfellowii]
MTDSEVDRTSGWVGDDAATLDEPIENRRDRILAIAAEEFETNGYAGARIDEIARRSSVNKQLIYYYFDSKRTLHSRVMEHVTDSALDETHEQPDQSYVKSVVHMCAASFSRMWNRLYRYWLWEAVEGSSQEEIARHAERREHYAKKLEQIRKSQLKGEIDPNLDPRFLHLGLVALVSFPHMTPQIASLVTGMDPDDPEFKEGQQAFVEHVMRALAPPSS